MKFNQAEVLARMDLDLMEMRAGQELLKEDMLSKMKTNRK